MADIDLDRNPIDLLAEEFAEQQRAGGGTTINEYCQRHPDLADQIRELFPAILAMERLKRRNSRPGERETIAIPPRLGDYRMVREIGRGGMGVVYEAEQESLGRRVAVKIFSHAALRDVKHLQRFEREAKTAARLHHTNIVPVFGVGHHEGLHYYVMQLIRGRGLDEVLHELRRLRATDPHRTTEFPEAMTHVADSPENLFSAADAARWLRSGRFAARSSGSSGSGLVATQPDSGSSELANRVSEPTTKPLSDPPVTDSVPAADALAPGAGQRLIEPPRDDPPSGPSDPRDDRRYWESVASIGIQVAEALQYAHSQQVLHRDIKPANLLLDARGTVWITDFGLAKAVSQDDVSRTGDIVGTLRYMSPEQFDGKCDARSDVYSLGLTLYELLTLRPAFDDPDRTRLIQRVTQGNPTPPRKLAPHVPRDLETIVLKAIVVDAGRRYRSAGEVAADLRCFLEDLPIRARRATPVERIWRWSRRNPAIATLSMLLLIALMGVTWKWREVEAEKVRVQAEKHRAQTESTRAELNLSLALDTMERVLEQFSSSWMAHPTEPQIGEEESNSVEFRIVASAETSIRVLEDLLSFYNRFADQNAEQMAGNPRLRSDTAKANQHVGDIRQRLDRFAEAEEAYERALGLYVQLTHDHPENTSYVREMAATYNQLGNVRLRMDRRDEAEQASRAALEILTAQLTKAPPCNGCRFELAHTHETLGVLLQRPSRRRTAEDPDPLQQAEQHHREALRILEELIRSEPAKPEYRFAQARSYRNLYSVLAFSRRRESRGPGGREPDKAVEARERAIDLLKSLCAEFPGVPDYQCELAEMLIQASRQFGRRGPFPRREIEPTHAAEQEQQLREAIRLAQDLNKKYHLIPRYRMSLAWSTGQLAELLRQTERQAEAVPLYNDTLDILRSLAEQYPDLPSYPMFLSFTYQALGETHADLKQPYDADRAFEEALRQPASLAQSGDNGPEKRFAQSRLAMIHEQQGNVLRQLHRLPESKLALEQAIQLQLELVNTHEQEPFPGPGWMRSRFRAEQQLRLVLQYESLAETLDQLPEPLAAQKARTQAAELRKTLEEPPQPETQPEIQRRREPGGVT